MYKIIMAVSMCLTIVAQPVLAAECSPSSIVPEAKALKGKLQLSELLPNPSASEEANEFVELYNGTDQTLNLDGFTLQDASNKPIALAGSLASKHYLAFYRPDTNISLNNSGDTVALLHPDGKVIDTVAYAETAKEDASFSRVDGSWAWTQPTPGKVNKSPEPDAVENESVETDESSQNYQFSDDVSLSELLPDPEGSDTTDEWIELYNAGNALDLYGWQLRDSSKTYTIEESLTIPAQGYLVIPVTDSGISLNNSGETIELVDPNDTEMDSVAYPSSTSGQSYNYLNGAWQWSPTLTPGTANVAGASTEPDNINTSDDVTSGVTIASVKTQASGTEVTVSGVVTALPATYSVNYFYMQDSTSGIQVYSSSKNFPVLALGDAVSVHGTVSSTNGEPKLNVIEVSVTAQNQTTTSKTVTSLTVDDAGLLVTLTGVVQSKATSTLSLDSGLVYIKRGTDISLSAYSAGQSLTVTGVVSSTNDGVQLWPRQQTDISTGATAAALTDPLISTAHAADPQQVSVATATETGMVTNNQSGLLWLGIASGIVLLLMRLARVPWLKTVVRNWVGSTARAWASRLHQKVG